MACEPGMLLAARNFRCSRLSIDLQTASRGLAARTLPDHIAQHGVDLLHRFCLENLRRKALRSRLDQMDGRQLAFISEDRENRAICRGVSSTSC